MIVNIKNLIWINVFHWTRNDVYWWTVIANSSGRAPLYAIVRRLNSAENDGGDEAFSDFLFANPRAAW